MNSMISTLETMNGTFNAQILVDKLAKLNNSQQSIETLSHWCIFHRKKAKQVVETWDRQFHCAPQDQRVPFLYLANDILQNSRRKGSEFVGEFWKVLPHALSDVLENGDEFGRNAAMRLVDIWEERKVFGSRGQVLKEEILGRNLENNSKIGKSSVFKLKQSIGDTLEKIISSYEVVYDGHVDEEDVLKKCKSAISSVEQAEKDIGSDFTSGNRNGSELLVELQGQHGILRECIAQLKSAESSRATLVSSLRGALQEQELKLDQLRDQLEVAQSRSDQAGNICQQLIVNCNGGQMLPEQRLKEATTTSDAPPASFVSQNSAGSGEKEQFAPVVYAQRGSFVDGSPHIEEEQRKTAAAAVAAKLAASTSSAQMLSFVLSSLASEGVIGNKLSESPLDCPSEKRPKLENGSYVPAQVSPPLPPFPHPESLQHKSACVSQQMSAHQPPPPPNPASSPVSHPGTTMQPSPPLPPMPPPVQPPPPTQYMQTGGSMSISSHSYGTAQQPPLPGYPMVGTSVSGGPSYPPFPLPYQNFHVSDGGFYCQPSLPPTSSLQ